MKSDEGGMKDIDFDELDRAVNSVIGGAQTDNVATPVKQEQSSKAPSEPPAKTDDAPAEKAATVPSEDAPSLPSTEPTTPPKVQAAMPAARRGGRFMDVVHPSADMKQPAATPPSKKISLAPIHQDVKPSDAPAATAEPADAQPTPAPADETAPTPVAAWPDPLDVANATADAETLGVVTETPEPAQVPQTPFLHHTKVEKRPLGAFAETAAETDSSDAEPPSFTEKMEQEAALQAKQESAESDDDVQMVPSPDLPPEYHPDLVAIESKEMTVPELDVSLPEKESAPEVAKTTEPAEEQPHEKTKTEVIEDKAAPTASPTEPASIPPQYRLQDVSPDDAEPHAIFDTQAYHQPLLPAKTRHRLPAWAWVLLIIGLLIAGAGLGALFFILGY